MNELVPNFLLICALHWCVYLLVAIALCARERNGAKRDIVAPLVQVLAGFGRATVGAWVGLAGLFVSILSLVFGIIVNVYHGPLLVVAPALILLALFANFFPGFAALWVVRRQRARLAAARTPEADDGEPVQPSTPEIERAKEESTRREENFQLNVLLAWASSLPVFVTFFDSWLIFLLLIALIVGSTGRRDMARAGAHLSMAAGVGSVASRQRVIFDETFVHHTSPLIGALDLMSRYFVFPRRGWGVLVVRLGDDDRDSVASDNKDGSDPAVPFFRRKIGGIEQHVYWRKWWDSWSLVRPTVPASLVRELPYDTISAAIAMRCCMLAGNPRREPLVGYKPPRARQIAIAVFVLGLGVMGGLALMPSLGNARAGLILLFQAMLPLAIVSLLMTSRSGNVSTKGGGYDESTIYYRKGLELWRDVAKPDDPSAASMVLHLITFDRVVEPDTPIGDLIARYFESTHYTRLLDGKESEDYKQALRDASQIVTDDAILLARCEVG